MFCFWHSTLLYRSFIIPSYFRASLLWMLSSLLCVCNELCSNFFSSAMKISVWNCFRRFLWPTNILSNYGDIMFGKFGLKLFEIFCKLRFYGCCHPFLNQTYLNHNVQIKIRIYIPLSKERMVKTVTAPENFIFIHYFKLIYIKSTFIIIFLKYCFSYIFTWNILFALITKLWLKIIFSPLLLTL